MKMIALLAFPFLLFLIASARPLSSRVSAAEKLTSSYTGGLKERLAAREISTSELKELLRTSAAAGRPLLINFWATWCHGCRQEMPDLVKISRQYRAREWVEDWYGAYPGGTVTDPTGPPRGCRITRELYHHGGRWL